VNGVAFHNYYLGPKWSDASNWASAAGAAGIRVDTTPARGAVAWWSGHVAYVESVNANGSVVITEMNYDLHNSWRKYTAWPGSPKIGGWPSRFIHVKDLPGTHKDPANIVCPLDSGFQKSGPDYWWPTNNGYSGSGIFTYVWSSRWNYIRWTFDLSKISGTAHYKVEAYIPGLANKSVKADYHINTASGLVHKVVNQSSHGNVWVDLGTYQLSQGSAWIELDDYTGEPYTDRTKSPRVVFDAIRLTFVSPPPPTDTTPPVVSIAGVTEGTTYAAPVTPTFSATDANLASVVATLNGAAFTSGTPVSKNGTYSLVVTAKDKSNNTTTKTVGFTVAIPLAATLTLHTLPAYPPGSYYPGDTVPISFTLKNTGDLEGTWTDVTLALRTPTSENLDRILQRTLTLAGGASKTFDFTLAPGVVGTWKGWVTAAQNGTPATVGANPSLTLEVKPRPATLTHIGSLSLPAPPYYKGKALSISFTLKNTGGTAGTWEAVNLVIRDPQGAFRGQKASDTLTLAPGEQKRFTVSLTPDQIGTWEMWPAAFSDGTWTTAEGTTPVTFTVTFAPPTYRMLAGADRYLTAILVSKTAYPNGAPAVVLAKGDDFPDALAAAPLAKAYNGPVILTPSGGLTDAVRAELKRLNPKTVLFIGLPQNVKTQLQAALPTATVKTFVGRDRYHTATLIAEELKKKQGSLFRIVLVPGDKFPDALSAAPLAAKMGWAILLTPASGPLPPVTRDAFGDLGVTKALVVGTNVKLPASVTQVVSKVGRDRYHTSALVAAYAKAVGLSFSHTALATGENFPDALVVGPFLAKRGGILLLTRPSGLPTDIQDLLDQEIRRISLVDLVGLPGSCRTELVGRYGG